MSELNDLPPEGDGGHEEERPRVRKAPTAFRTISEVADELHIPQHVLRFWETKFPQVKPLKRGGGRRYYRPDDLVLLRRISDLLYIQGYTIKGVQRLLREGASRSGEGGAGTGGEAEDMAGEATDSEMDLSQVPDEELDRMMREAEPQASLVPPKAREAHTERDGEAERLRSLLRETLAALEALRAMLG